MEVRVTDLLDITVFDFWGLGMTYSRSWRDLVIETGLNLKTFQLVVQCGIQVLLLNLLKIEYSRIVASKWGLLNKLLSGLVGYDFWASCHFPESHLIFSIVIPEGFPDGSDSEQSACNAGDLGSIPGSRRSPGGGNGNPLQYFYAWRIPGTEEPGGLQSTELQSWT